jgi:glutathione S-transferase
LLAIEEPPVKLYDLAWGPWCRRVTIYLKEKGISGVEVVSLKYGDEQSSEMLKKNPLSYLPFLELDDGRILADTLAIIEYFEELYPTPNFMGRDPVERAKIRAYLYNTNELGTTTKYQMAHRLPEFKRFITQYQEVADALQPFVDRSLAGLELLAHDQGPFLMGDRVTVADCALFPLLQYIATNHHVQLLTDGHPKLTRWYAMFVQRPSAPVLLRDDGLLATDPDNPPPGTYWWQKPKPELARLKNG